MQPENYNQVERQYMSISWKPWIEPHSTLSRYSAYPRKQTPTGHEKELAAYKNSSRKRSLENSSRTGLLEGKTAAYGSIGNSLILPNHLFIFRFITLCNAAIMAITPRTPTSFPGSLILPHPGNEVA